MGSTENTSPVSRSVRLGAGEVVSRPDLWAQLDASARVTVVSAPAGSGKTVLLRSWMARADRDTRVAWVPVAAGERDGKRFWIAVADALRGTTAGSALVRPLTAAPDLDGWVIVEQLLEDLAGLADRVWLIVDDVHELTSADTLRQLELLVLRGPDQLRLILATRRDLELGLHRLRLEGELNEIRAADLRLSLAEAQALLTGGGVALSDNALALLYARTEGWAAGLRLAALSMAGHQDPEQFAVDFSGSERTVAGYLLAEVLQRQSEPVRRLLLRTSVLERVCGELADQLTGGVDGERVLQDLERAGACVTSINARRSWFRYHQLFADLLQLELRRTAPADIPELHRTAAEWFARHGFPVEAVRHAQAGQDWDLAARLLADRWIDLYLNGQDATARKLLAGFPAAVVIGDAELTALMALNALSGGSSDEAERYLGYADREPTADLETKDGGRQLPTGRRKRLHALLSIARLWLAQQRVDPRAVAAEVDRLLAFVQADIELWDLGGDVRALAMVNLGIAEIWSGRLEVADQHLTQGVALARRIGRPYLELIGLAHGARVAVFRSLDLAEQRSQQAIELAQRHGWGEDQTAAFACTMLGAALTGQGRLAEAEPWLDRARRTLRTDAHPADGVSLHYACGLLEMARGRHADALADLRTGERLASTLVTPHTLVRPMRALLLMAHVQLGETDHAEAIWAGLDEHEKNSAHLRIALASVRLAQHDPQAALATLAPILADSSSATELQPSWMVEALLLGATARDELGDPDAAGRALERALEVAEPHRELVSFLLHPVPTLLRRQSGQRTAHAALIADIIDLLAGNTPVSRSARISRPLEPLSGSELRVLRYLPTHLSAPEIAAELSVSTSTVKTHLRNLYAKLSVHRRTDAVEVARTLHLLAPSAHRR